MNRTYSLDACLLACGLALSGCFKGDDLADDEVGVDTEETGESSDTSSESSDTSSESSDTSSDSTEATTESTDTDTSSESTEDEGPPPDTDMDTIPDGDDNCPDLANPNQLDFDGDGSGNVCDVMTFTMVEGWLESTLWIDTNFNDCDVPMEFVPTAAAVQVQLDDNAQLARLELTELHLSDVLDENCPTFIFDEVSVKNFVMTNGGDPFPVSVPHNQADHDAGAVTGVTDLPHPMAGTVTVELWDNADPLAAAELMLDITLPVAQVNVSNAGAQLVLTWNSGQPTIAEAVLEYEDPFPQMANLAFEGLDGMLTLTP